MGKNHHINLNRGRGSIKQLDYRNLDGGRAIRLFADQRIEIIQLSRGRVVGVVETLTPSQAGYKLLRQLLAR